MSATTTTVTAGTDAAPKKVSGWRHLAGLLPYLKRYWGKVAIGIATLLAMGLVGNIPPLVLGAIVDSISGNAAPQALSKAIMRPLVSFLLPYYHPSSQATIGVFCLVFVALFLVKGVLSFWTRWVLIGVSRDIEYDLRDDVLVHLTKLEPEFYVRNRTGELMSRCTNDLASVRMVLGPGIMYSATTMVTMVLAVIVMAGISPRLTLYVLIPVPIVAVAVRYFGKLIHDLYEKIQASLATLSAKAQENLAGVRVIRAYRQEDAEIAAFDTPNREYVGRNIQLIRAWSMFMPSLSAFIGATVLIILWQGGREAIGGRLSVGTIVAFNAYMIMLTWPMVALGWVTNIFQRGAASMGRLNYILDTRPKISDAAARGGTSQDIRGEIEFRGLNFTYPTKREAPTNGNGVPNRAHSPEVLKEISLRVPAGSTLAIVGPTGSGKSTLAALVARLWEAPSGSVLLDGRPIREWPLAAARRAIGFVPQETFLFSDTIRENIAFGVEGASAEAVADAAQIASIASEIEGFPKQYETLVGERGITLSGGQKQRTALARALLRDPRILILDDALSSVDTDTEEQILRRLKDVMRHRTTILVSHRCSTVKHADQIIVLKEGRIVERGTHDELLALGGYYNDLYQKQLLEEELAQA